LVKRVFYKCERKRKEIEEGNLKLKNIVVILLMSVMLLASITLLPTFAADPPVVPEGGAFEKYGPHIDHLIFKVAGDLAKETEFLKKGEIDVMDWAAPAAVIDAWMANPDITMGDYSEWGWYEFDLNLQMWPIGHGSMRPELGADGGAPMPPEANWDFPETWDEGDYWINYTDQRDSDSRDFRRALSHLVNRASGASVPARIGSNMETFIYPAIKDWENPAAAKYPYDEEATAAKALLNNAGFNDYDGDGKLEYSKSHATPTPPTPPADMEELPELQLWIRVDDPDRKYAGELLRDEMLLLGIPVDAYIASRTLCYYHAWTTYDYHIYTGGWSWGRVPDHYFELWYSEKDTYPSPSGDAYNRYHSKEYDDWAWELKTAADIPAAKAAVFKCQEVLHRDVACIPLYTYKGWIAHRTYYPSTSEIPGLPEEEQKYSGKEWKNWTNALGYSFFDDFNALNLHVDGFEKGGTMRHGLLIDVVKFDPVDAEWFYDALVLDKVYEPLITYHPNDTTAYVPWLCKDYSVGEWDGPTGLASKVTFEIVPNILWHDNVPFTPYDAAFSYQYYKDTLSVPNSWAVVNFVKAESNATHVTLYFDVKSWLVLEWCLLNIIPAHIWEPIPPTLPGDPTVPGSWAYDPEAEDTVIGTGPFRFAKDGVVGRVDRVPGQYVHLERNPTYFRKYIWPDVCDASHTPCQTDGWVDLDDIMEVAKPGNIFKGENPDGTWPTPPGAWGEHCDVNKDGYIGVLDIMEVGVNIGKAWPPEWF
jgi:ABC-type transport system substrate-binding protein